MHLKIKWINRFDLRRDIVPDFHLDLSRAFRLFQNFRRKLSRLT